MNLMLPSCHRSVVSTVTHGPLNMANGIFSRLYRTFKTFDQAIDIILGRGLPPGNLYAIGCSTINGVKPVTLPGQSITDILKDTFLWAVPKKRRTLEKRLNRRYGVPKYNWKPHVPKPTTMCRKCGYEHEAGTLCGYCYEIIKKETIEMQNAIKESLKLDPIEQDVIVLYEGEKDTLRDDFWKNQRIVELPKKRPEWFGQNILQPSTEKASDLETKKPEDGVPENIKNN